MNVIGQQTKTNTKNKDTLQPKKTALVFTSHFKNNFTFTKKWEYPESTFKNDKGEFDIDEDRPLIAADTAHLYYTAACTTNVQGGYEVNYCYATKVGKETLLTFTGGLPAFASSYFVHIEDSSFWCEPQVVYPRYYPGQKIAYQILTQTLQLERAIGKPGKKLKGYIAFEFLETTQIPNKEIIKRSYLFKGYFLTTLTD